MTQIPVPIIWRTDPYYDDTMRSMKETADFFDWKVTEKDLYEAMITKFDVVNF